MDGSHNPYLKKAILQAVENQINDNNPPETKKTLNRLMKNGYSREEAIELIGSVVGSEIYQYSNLTNLSTKKDLLRH